jgi:hypothetical protein
VKTSAATAVSLVRKLRDSFSSCKDDDFLEPISLSPSNGSSSPSASNRLVDKWGLAAVPSAVSTGKVSGNGTRKTKPSNSKHKAAMSGIQTDLVISKEAMGGVRHSATSSLVNRYKNAVLLCHALAYAPKVGPESGYFCYLLSGGAISATIVDAGST